jgi:hypothetical protein
MPSTPDILFAPSPDQTSLIIDQLASDDLSLRDIADEHNTTIEALTAFMTRPDIRERLANLQSACAARSRVSATNKLPLVIKTLTAVLLEYIENAYNSPVNPKSTLAFEQRRREAETARKAAAILYRLMTFDPTRARQRPLLTSPERQRAGLLPPLPLGDGRGEGLQQCNSALMPGDSGATARESSSAAVRSLGSTESTECQGSRTPRPRRPNRPSENSSSASRTTCSHPLGTRTQAVPMITPPTPSP